MNATPIQRGMSDAVNKKQENFPFSVSDTLTNFIVPSFFLLASLYDFLFDIHRPVFYNAGYEKKTHTEQKNNIPCGILLHTLSDDGMWL